MHHLNTFLKINKSFKIINFISWMLISFKKKKKEKHTAKKKTRILHVIFIQRHEGGVFTTSKLQNFTSLRGVPEGSTQLRPTQLTRMWRLEEEERGKAFPKSSFPWKEKKKKRGRRREREAEQRYFHWHGSRAAISFFHHTTNMSLLFWHLLTLTSKSSSLLKNYLSLGMN